MSPKFRHPFANKNKGYVPMRTASKAKHTSPHQGKTCVHVCCELIVIPCNFSRRSHGLYVCLALDLNVPWHHRRSPFRDTILSIVWSHYFRRYLPAKQQHLLVKSVHTLTRSTPARVGKHIRVGRALCLPGLRQWMQWSFSPPIAV